MSTDREPLLTENFDEPDLISEGKDENLEDNEDYSDAALLQAIEVTTERLAGRGRQLSASIHIPHSLERVWQILTDYDHLADFIPNLATSRRIAHPQGGIRIEQVGTQSLLKFKFCARVVLDMIEQCPHRLDFEMVEGDFKAFSGSWILQPIEATEATTQLCYQVSVLPPRTMPIGLIERRLKSNLAVNLTAIRRRADQLFGY
ncbi:MAG: SRPBCC family protein [Synechococcales cyanobacterium C42_A2020_086]|jgi:ribosome-associated toxin RatA of RatAB toxin-antitoxin module|nr:SRPBCC family protein [Synechococcales cyanobacterium C42_A2020_086]